MVFKPLYAFIVLVNVLAILVTSSARSTGLVRLTDRRDELDRPVYLWTIGQDEQDRLSTLLEADFYDTGVAGTYVTAPPQVCPYCGKETEFFDWVYTALERGVHSPGFIFDSLKAGNTPKGVHHDVYCSGCGHLTHVRDRTGNEGGALHISHATPYDRSTKTFGKRTPASEAAGASASVDEPTSAEKLEEAAFWGLRGSWVSKREENLEGGELEASAKAVSVTGDSTAGWPAGGNFRWVLKRAEEVSSEPAVEPVPDNTAGWPAGGNFRWVLKRGEAVSSEADDEATFETRETTLG